MMIKFSSIFSSILCAVLILSAGASAVRAATDGEHWNQDEILDVGTAGVKYEQTSTGQLLANYYAKEFCSCIFVIGQSREVCQRDVKHISAVMGVEIDRERQEIRTNSLFYDGVARFMGAPYGCNLIQ